jgi:hypothetical protein
MYNSLLFIKLERQFNFIVNSRAIRVKAELNDKKANYLRQNDKIQLRFTNYELKISVFNSFKFVIRNL